MSQFHRIAIADGDPFTLLLLKKYLQAAGHEIAVEAQSREELLQRTSITNVDIVVTDINLPGIENITTFEAVFRDRELPIVILSTSFDENVLDQANEYGVFGYLLKPIRSEELLASIAVAVKRFEEFQHLHEETATLRQTLADRKIIEQAKGILMRKHEIEESDAFLELQHAARDSRAKIVDVARGILLASKVHAAPSHDQPTTERTHQ